MLQVATDKPGLVDKGLLALADFAGAMTLDPKEIDKERGVVIEEWRLRQGAGVAHPREAGAGALLQVALRAANPDRDARDPSHVHPGPAARFLRDVVSAGADGGRRDRRHRSGGAREESSRATFGSLADKRPPAPDPDRSVPPHAETLVNVAADPEGAGDHRLAAAQDADAAAEPCRRLPPRPASSS